MNSSTAGIILFSAFFSVAAWSQSGLDSGPWPTQDHDSRRSNQSGLSGPASPGTPQLIYDAGSPILSEMVITSDGKLVLGGCVSQTVANQIVAIDATGKRVWPAPYTLVASNNESPMGFTVDASGRIYVAVHDCPDIPGSVPVHLYSVLPNGTSAQNWPIGFSAMYEPPAIAADGTIYQMDELTTLSALRSSDGSAVWTTGFCCYGQGAIALDSTGNLYAAADGDYLGSSGLWSWTPSGALRWTALSGTGAGEYDRLFNTTVISPADIIYTASLSGTVYAFDTNGTLLPGWPFATGSPTPSDSQRDPLAVGGSGTVYIKTLSAVFAINPNGTQKWNYSPGGDGSVSPVVILDKDENAYFAFGNTVYSLTSAGALRWSVPLNAPGRLYIGASGVLYVIDGHQQVFTIGGGFLSFPLPNRTAFSAKINTVFDHSMDHSYCADGVITAYTGEQGKAEFGKSKFLTSERTCHSEPLYGFRPDPLIASSFSINGQYDRQGQTDIDRKCCFLFYDGHPGYDYRTVDQNPSGEIPVLAAAPGVVTCARYSGCDEGPGEIKIDHGNGYFTIYLHLSWIGVTERENIAAAGVRIGVSGQTGAEGAPHLHFEVRLGTTPVDPYGWHGNSNIKNDPYTRALNVNLWR